MCACEPSFTCTRCRGTWLDPHYLDLPDHREQEEEARYTNMNEVAAWLTTTNERGVL